MPDRPRFGTQTQLVKRYIQDKKENEWKFINKKDGSFNTQAAREYLKESLAPGRRFQERMQVCFPEGLRSSPEEPEEEAGRKLELQAEYLYRKVEALGLEKPTKAQLKSWLSGKNNIQNDRAGYNGENLNQSRELKYALCGVLGYDYQETVDFFWKVAFTPPFKRKVWTELVYYHTCRSRPDSWYADARRLIDEIRQARKPETPQEPKVQDTYLIEQAAEDFQSDQELKDYILSHWDSFERTNFGRNARETIKLLYQTCVPYALGEAGWDQEVEKGEIPSEMSHRKFMESLMGTLKLTERDLWPEAVRNQFPANNLLDRVLQDDPSLSDDVLRKMVILLSFYLFYAELRQEKAPWAPDERYVYSKAQDAKTDYSSYFQEFCNMVESDLLDAGYGGGLYARNPYDCLFLIAATSAHPLQALKSAVSGGE